MFFLKLFLPIKWISLFSYEFLVLFLFLKILFKGKIKGGIGWNLRISGVEWYLLDIYLMFLSREIDIKLCHTLDQNSNKWQSSINVTCLCLYHVTSKLHCHWWDLLSPDTDLKLHYHIYLLELNILLSEKNDVM